MPAIVDVEKCDGCKSCEEACPSDAIKVVEAVAVVNVDDCIDCNACEDACPNHAIKVES
jgi:NAD-dependent dihydropyrimidine dehydrogenase PreA subunit